jgi:signal transduction histidine kinase
MLIEVHARAIHHSGQNLILSVVRDITQRKKIENQMVITDRLASVGELASGIAHEVNNPLTGVIGFAQLLLEKDLPPDVLEDLTIIHDEAERASEVLKNLLSFARNQVPHKNRVGLNGIIERVLKLRAYEHRIDNISVDTKLSPDLPEVYADSAQLQQCFLNIVINAEHFMKKAHHRGLLSVETQRVNGNVQVSFRDDGPGIPADAIGHIFDPFFTTKDVGEGTGLGLSICHGLIESHGGRIWAESQPGQGATFIIELPAALPGFGEAEKS